MDLVSLISLIVGIVTLAGVVYAIGRWVAKIEGRLTELSNMLNTLWNIYVVDVLRNKPGLAEQHSDFHLKKEGLDLIPDELKDRLDEIIGGNPGPSKAGGRFGWLADRPLWRAYRRPPQNSNNIASGYLVVKTLGLERIKTWASEKDLSVQEGIAILSAYLAERIPSV